MGKYTLVLDTSYKYLVVGLAKDGAVIDKIQYGAFQRQSEYAVSEVENILKRNNISAKDLSRVVITNGPGSYTGIRIALTIGKTLASFLNIGFCPISTLNAIAGVRGKKIALLDARSKRAYLGIYENGKKVIEDKVVTIEELKELLND